MSCSSGFFCAKGLVNLKIQINLKVVYIQIEDNENS